MCVDNQMLFATILAFAALCPFFIIISLLFTRRCWKAEDKFSNLQLGIIRAAIEGNGHILIEVVDKDILLVPQVKDK